MTLLNDRFSFLYLFNKFIRVFIFLCEKHLFFLKIYHLSYDDHGEFIRLFVCFRNKIFMFMLVVFLKVYKRKKISGRIHKKKTVCV